MSIRSEIELRLGRRIQAEKDIRGLKPPGLLCVDAMKDFQAIYKEKREEFMDNSMMETHDMRVLIGALDLICATPEIADEFITLAWSRRELEPELKKYLDNRAVEEQVAREKAAKSDKKQGENIPGQLNIFDDKSEAEPASEVSCTTIDDYLSQIRDAQDVIVMSDSDLDAIYKKHGFDGTILAERQVTVYADVLAELEEIITQLDLALVACSSELKLQVLNYVRTGDTLDAVTVLKHHFIEVVGDSETIALADTETVIAWARDKIALEASKPVEAPPAETVIVELPPLEITADAEAEILAHFVNGPAQLGVSLLLQLIAVQHEALSQEDQGLLLDEQIARFENLAEAQAKLDEGLNDLEKAAAKRKKSGAKSTAKKPTAKAKK